MHTSDQANKFTYRANVIIENALKKKVKAELAIK